MSKSAPSTGPTDLLDRWLAYHEEAADTPDPSGDGTPAPPEDPAPHPAADAPSAVDAGRIVLEALAQRTEADGPVGTGLPEQGSPPATEEDPETGTGEVADAGPEVLGSAAGPARSEVSEREAASPPPARPAPISPARPDRPAADSQVAPPAAAPAPTRAPTLTRRPPVAAIKGPGPVRFPPRRGGRRALTALSLAALVGAVGTAHAAWTSRTPVTLGTAVGLVALAWLLWGARSRATGTEMSIEDGVLRIVRGTSRYQFPLAGTHPPIDIVGEPGDRKWRVLIQRRSMAPFTIDRRMVDPVAFSEALRRYRPHA